MGKGKKKGDDDQKNEPSQKSDSGSSSQNQPPQQQRSQQTGPKDTKKFKDDWVCASCNFNNYSRNTECHRCQEPKAGPSGNFSSQNEPRQQQQKKSVSKDDKYKDSWVCESCNFKNFAQNSACHKCKAPKGVSASSSTQYQPKRVEQQPVQKPEPSQKQEPPMKKPEQPPKQKSQGGSQNLKGGDWECDKCKRINFAKKNTCKNCNEPRKIEQVVAASQEAQSVSSQKPMERPQSQQSQQSTASMPDTKGLKISGRSGVIESSPDGRVYEGTRGAKCVVEVNYATITLKNLPKKAFHYDVTFLPDTPKKMLAAALEAFMQKFFPGSTYGFDGRKNIYTAKELVRNGTIIEQFKEKIEAHLLDRKKEFEITIKYAATVDMSVLLNHTNRMYQTEDRPSSAIQVLDIILRSAFRRNIENNSAIQAGRAVYFVPNRNDQNDLGDGMELWYGLFQSAILGRAKLYMNVDVLHKAFPSALPLMEFLRTLNRDSRDTSIPSSLNDQQKNRLREFLAMLSVGYRINPNEPLKTYGFNGVGEEASRAMFIYQNKRMSVQEYFARVKNIPLKYPNLPVLWVGSRSKPPEERTYLPIEFCEIPPGQATNKKCTPNCIRGLIRYSATSSDIRKRKIQDLLRRIDYRSDPTIMGFGIDIDKNFQKTDARVIDPPNLLYSGNESVTPQRGVWNERNFMEVDGTKIKWCILNCDNRTTLQTIDGFKRLIIQEARRQRLFLEDMKTSEIKNFDLRDRRSSLQNVLDDMKKNGYKFVVVIVTEQDNNYARVKQAAELQVGILTQCIKSLTLLKRMNPSTVKNILLKLNAKLNGKNHEIQEISYNTINAVNSGVMFVGADVTHPSPDQKSIPSVVGVASSYDQVGFKYCCAWRLQDPRQEMIVDLEDILTEHLKFYGNANKRLPTKILYYRDGVSDGQFREVLEIEMTAIQNALRRVYGTTKHAEVTFIVVQKRHHTRFFPTDPKFSDGRNNNIVPGTVVDKNIVHPFQNQFFLASHAAIQGVTKPTKYCVLRNESNISPDDLQAITYDLCHLFTRCSRSVSYPAPTYYAHLVAARGKNYIVGHERNLNMNNLQREYENRRINPAFVQNTPMFFV